VCVVIPGNVYRNSKKRSRWRYEICGLYHTDLRISATRTRWGIPYQTRGGIPYQTDVRVFFIFFIVIYLTIITIIPLGHTDSNFI
jgi:hypothetical protein